MTASNAKLEPHTAATPPDAIIPPVTSRPAPDLAPSTPARRATILTALITALLVLVLGGLGSAVVLTYVQRSVENDARQDATLLADSVARTLVQQFEKAGRYGIPFDRLPGVQAALQRTLDDVPGLARIILTNAAGATLNQAERMGTVARDTVRVPIAVAGESLGAIAIATAPAELAAAFDTVRRVCALTTLLLSLLAGLIAARWAGALLDARRAQLQTALAASAAGRFELNPDLNLASATHGSDAVAIAFRALADGQAAQREQREAFDAYAQELLAVDFDGSQRDPVDAWRRVAQGMDPQVGSKQGSRQGSPRHPLTEPGMPHHSVASRVAPSLASAADAAPNTPHSDSGAA